MENLDNERHSTMQRYTAAQEGIKSVNDGIKELKVGMMGASEGMKASYEVAMASKQEELKEASAMATHLHDRLVELNKPMVEEDTDFPYAHYKRSELSDEMKARIVRQYGMEQYRRMPL